MNCLPTYKGHRFKSEAQLKKYLESKISVNQFNSMPSSELRIQLDVERDTEAQNKKLSTQIINIIGVMNSVSNAFEKVHTAMSKLLDAYVNRVMTDNGKPSKSFINDLKVQLRKHGASERLATQKFANYNKIGLNFQKKKLLSSIVSRLNKKVMPELPGNSYAQATIQPDIYEYDDGTISVGYKKEGKQLKKVRGLNPMYITYEGKVLEAIERDGKIISPMQQYEELMKDESNRGKIEIKHGEVMMAYPYRKQFGLPPNTTLEESREFLRKHNPELLLEFEKSLEIVSLRIPMSNGSLGGKYKIVEFIEDSGNTIFIPEKKNILDGSDQDIDMQHVFFHTVNVNRNENTADSLDEIVDKNIQIEDETAKDEENIEGIDKQSEKELKQQIFDGLLDFYSNPENIPLIMSPVSMDILKEEAEKVSEENKRDGKLEWEAMPDTDMEMHKQNQDGKQVGYFANMNSFFARLMSLRNTAKDIVHSNIIKLFKVSNAIASSIMDFTNSLVNSATDNAKNNFNGRLNINDDTSALIAGMIAMGYVDNTAESQRDAIRLLRTPPLMDAVKRNNDSISILESSPNVYKKRLSEYFLSRVGVENMTKKAQVYNELDEEIKKKYGLPATVSNDEDFMQTAYNVVKLLRENKDISDTEKVGLNKIANIFLAEVSLIGDKIVAYGMVTSVVNEIPGTIGEINEYVYRFERYVGMSMQDFINGVDKSIEEKVQYVMNLERSRRYISDSEEETLEYVLTRHFDSEQSFDDNTILNNHPNFVSTINAINNLVNVVIPQMHFSQTLFNNGFKYKLKKTSSDALNRFDEAADRYIVGKYLTNVIGKNATFNGKTYDMANISERVKFVTDFYNFMDNLSSNFDLGFSESEFINRVVFETSFETGMPVLQLNVKYQEDPSIIASLERDVQKIDTKYKGFKEALGLYNLIVYGDSSGKGNFLDIVIDTNVHTGLSDYIKSVNEKIMSGEMQIDEEDVKTNISLMYPDLLLNKFSKRSENKGLTYEYVVKNKKNKSVRSTLDYRLRENGKIVSPVIGKDINIYGTKNVLLIDSYTQVQLDNKAHDELIRKGVVNVSGSRNFLIPYTANKTPEGGQFNGYTFYGERVSVKYKPSDAKGSMFKEYEVTLLEEVSQQFQDEVNSLKKEEDVKSCNLL